MMKLTGYCNIFINVSKCIALFSDPVSFFLLLLRRKFARRTWRDCIRAIISLTTASENVWRDNEKKREGGEDEPYINGPLSLLYVPSRESQRDYSGVKLVNSAYLLSSPYCIISAWIT